MWLSGYRRSIEGTSFPYHSFDPGIRTALLVRGNPDRPAIAWETAPVPGDLADDDVHFVWAFAMGADAHTVPFTLHVNDAPLVTFRGTSEGPLRFRETFRDRHGEPMGFAILSLPSGELPRGEPVRLRVTSEDRGSIAWYMTFEHEVVEGVSVDPVPLVRRDGSQEIRLSVTHLGDETEFEVRHEGRELAREPVRFGLNLLAVPLPCVDSKRTVDLEVSGGRTVTVVQEPVTKWTVYFVQHTHTDIGYTRPQTEILPEHLRFIDDALDFTDLTDDWPDDAKFRWTCEASWPVREYLRCRPTSQIERLRRRVADGRIELTGMMFNLSEIPDEPSLLRLLEPVKELRSAGLPVRLAMQNDVNGLAWCLADYFPAVGIDSFVMGQHPHRALACFERPTAFWWESPSGSRVLGWRADHYMTGNEWGIHGSDTDGFAAAMLRHLGDLEESDYPFDRVAIQYSGHVTDNAPPSLFGPETIRRWNEMYEWPKLRSATAGEFLDWVKEHHGDDLPVHCAAWPDWWTDGFGSAARETGAARRTHVDLIATQGIAAIAIGLGLGVPGEWAARVEAAYDALLFWDEHTLGATESITDPLCENSMVQWGEKAAYVWEAVKRTRTLQEAALGWLTPKFPRARTPVIVVLNTLGFARSGIVTIYVDHQTLPPHRRFRLLDADGREVAAQAMGSRSDGTYWRLHVHGVPALGWVTLRVVVDDDARPAPAALAGTTLSNDHYLLDVDPETGSLRRFVDRELGIDLVDGEADQNFLSVIYERLGNRHQLERQTLEDFERTTLSDVLVEPGVDGPVWQSLVVTGTTEGGDVRMEIRLFRDTKRVQVACSIRKKRVTDPEGLYVAFPFALPDGEVSYEVAGGIVVPGVDQLPGSSSDWHTVQNFTRVANNEAEVVISCDGVPLWQFGGLNLGEFRYIAKVERPHLYSWVMNNYWVTNFCASQEGEFRWHYDLTSGPKGKPSGAARFGWGSRVPLVGRVLPAASEERGEFVRSILTEDLSEHQLLVSASPTDDGESVLLHLRDTDGVEDPPFSVRFLRLDDQE